MRFFKFILFSALFGLFIIGGSYMLVNSQSEDFLYNNASKVPKTKVALVLGTAARTAHNRPNLFFKKRMDAAAKLYNSGKVRHLLVSGDNHVKSYNEPEDMQQALIARGVPASAITLDFAGFRTFDSVVRAKEVFGQSSIVIVSQPFHNQRAVFIAREKGIKAYGYNAGKVSTRVSPKTYVREYFARVKAVLDVYVLQTEPKFLGKKEII
ncbi:MAG: vancomycin high temperature exclusion protein [Bacteroidia bacterium]